MNSGGTVLLDGYSRYIVEYIKYRSTCDVMVAESNLISHNPTYEKSK